MVFFLLPIYCCKIACPISDTHFLCKILTHIISRLPSRFQNNASKTVQTQSWFVGNITLTLTVITLLAIIKSSFGSFVVHWQCDNNDEMVSDQ